MDKLIEAYNYHPTVKVVPTKAIRAAQMQTQADRRNACMYVQDLIKGNALVIFALPYREPEDMHNRWCVHVLHQGELFTVSLNNDATVPFPPCLDAQRIQQHTFAPPVDANRPHSFARLHRLIQSIVRTPRAWPNEANLRRIIDQVSKPMDASIDSHTSFILDMLHRHQENLWKEIHCQTR